MCKLDIQCWKSYKNTVAFYRWKGKKASGGRVENKQSFIPQTPLTTIVMGIRWRLPTTIRSRAADVTTEGQRTARTSLAARLWRLPGRAAALVQLRQPEVHAPNRITLPRRRIFIWPDWSMIKESSSERNVFLEWEQQSTTMDAISPGTALKLSNDLFVGLRTMNANRYRQIRWERRQAWLLLITVKIDGKRGTVKASHGELARYRSRRCIAMLFYTVEFNGAYNLQRVEFTNSLERRRGNNPERDRDFEIYLNRNG